MNKLFIKDINTVDKSKITLSEDKTYIKIRYKYKENISLIGIPFKLYNSEITSYKNYYYIDINDKYIKNIKNIDHYLFHKIQNYKTFLKGNKMIFYKNIFLDSYYEKYKGKKIDINIVIKYVKKGKDYYPIIHILDE